MDGVHDMGGRQGFGPIPFTPGAGAFHDGWERRANALYGVAVKLGLINMDEYRHAIERMDPRHYLSASYYERSLTGLATLCVEKGLATQAELEAAAQGGFPLSHEAAATAGRGNVASRQAWRVSDRVRVRDEHLPGHVRVPAYARGKCGVVVGISPAYPFPDAHAHGVEGAADEPTYDVRFRSEELWPGGAEPSLVHVGIFESYLEPAGPEPA